MDYKITMSMFIKIKEVTQNQVLKKKEISENSERGLKKYQKILEIKSTIIKIIN